MGFFNFNFIVPDNGANGTAGSALSLFRMAPVHFGSWFQNSMKQVVLASTFAATTLVGGAIAQVPPTDKREFPPRSIPLSAQQNYIIKENLKDMRIEQVPRTKDIEIGSKVPSNIG